MREIYLDSAATTRVSDACAHAAMEAMAVCWGNPSSGHAAGVRAERLLRVSRAAVAAELGVRDEEIFFTSGGTEANNLALLGAARVKARTGGRVITSAVEHSSVADSAAQLAKEGFDVVVLKPDRGGSIRVEDVEAALTDDTILLSFMLVNNETGAINPVADIARLLRRRRSTALLHCDAVQAFGKQPVRPSALGCDLLSLSGHKIHAPKGVGALYRKKGVRTLPIMFGGNQQDKLRPGTEPVPLIAALGEAVRTLPAAGERSAPIAALNAYARRVLTEPRMLEQAAIQINSPESGAPHVLSLATGCIKSEVMLNFLSERGIYVSAGSACAKGKPSHVLSALGLPAPIADSTIRVSFCRDNTTDDIDALADALHEALRTLARFR